MPYTLVRHKGEDYERWKPVFDGDSENLKKAGYRGYQLFRNADDSNEILVLFDVDDLEAIRQHGQSDELRRKMQEAGVIDRPDFYFLEEVEKLRA